MGLTACDSVIQEILFELGVVLLKTDLSKSFSGEVIRSHGHLETENVILQKVGKYWNRQNLFDRQDGLVVVTNRRFAFLAKVKTITTKTDFLSFPLELIENASVTRVMLISPAIEFEVAGKRYTFTFLANAQGVLDAMEAAKRNRLS